MQRSIAKTIIAALEDALALQDDAIEEANDHGIDLSAYVKDRDDIIAALAVMRNMQDTC